MISIDSKVNRASNKDRSWRGGHEGGSSVKDDKAGPELSVDSQRAMYGYSCDGVVIQLKGLLWWRAGQWLIQISIQTCASLRATFSLVEMTRHDRRLKGMKARHRRDRHDDRFHGRLMFRRKFRPIMAGLPDGSARGVEGASRMLHADWDTGTRGRSRKSKAGY